MRVCVFMYIINNGKGVGVARQETTKPTLLSRDFEFWSFCQNARSKQGLGRGMRDYYIVLLRSLH